MPFLASENILIDPAQCTVILPSNEDDKEDDVAGESMMMMRILIGAVSLPDNGGFT
jgi:hypothetical protein